MDLDVIDLPAAVTLLRTRVPDLDDDVAQEIAEELGRLPLALEQAAAYLDRVRDAAPGLPGPAARAGPAICTRGARSAGATTRSPRCGTSAWSAISREDPAAVVLLELCAYLAPEPIPLDLFTAHADLLPAAAVVSCRRPAGLQRGHRDPGGLLAGQADRRPGLQLHRLVQGVIRARHAITSPRLARSGVLMTADTSAAREDDEHAGGGAGPAARRCPRADHGRPAGLAAVGGAAAARAGRDQPLRDLARTRAGRGRGRCVVAAGSRRDLPAGPCPAGRGPAAGRTGPGHRPRPPTAPTTPPSPPA